MNWGTRLAKSPRLLWVDSGLAAHLAGYREKSGLSEGRPWGACTEAHAVSSRIIAVPFESLPLG